MTLRNPPREVENVVDFTQLGEGTPIPLSPKVAKSRVHVENSHLWQHHTGAFEGSSIDGEVLPAATVPVEKSY